VEEKKEALVATQTISDQKQEPGMANNRVLHFEIPANEPQALAKFYGDLFGWTYERFPNGPVEYWNLHTGSAPPGIDGGIVKRQNPQHPCLNYVDVANLDATIEKATTLGAQLAMRKPIPTVGEIACLVDPEGNVFGLLQRSM
jgi:uncharacterized protein